ncbi:MAG: GNAT family N-acetyltransferase [Clostridia bacterium]|nr:GNAT family N-acetyltransferase [Clostridia bacterium]
MNQSEYLADPCGASSLPLWKAERLKLPEGIQILRDDRFAGLPAGARDERYFRLIHRMEAIPEAWLPEGFAPVSADAEAFAQHINACYEQEGVTAAGLLAYREHPVYRPGLWIAAAEEPTGALAATGIAELDGRVGEGILEWIQVSPEHRRKGLGRWLVCELLRRLQGQARFVTVSGRLDSPSSPCALYRSCGFEGAVVWHVVQS